MLAISVPSPLLVFQLFLFKRLTQNARCGASPGLEIPAQDVHFDTSHSMPERLRAAFQQR
jgi:hypothetical protein